MFLTSVHPRNRRKPIVANGDFNRFFNHLMYDTPKPVAAKSAVQTKPAANVKETDTAFMVDLALPGLSKKDIHINVEDLVLTIHATHETTEEEGVLRTEFDYRNFKRSFRLPQTADADNIKATFKNGVLTLTIHKKPEAQPRQIQVV